MLNPFPIQFLAPLAYVLLRLAVGLLLIKKGSQLYHRSPNYSVQWFSASVQVVTGTLFVFGLYTQLAALAGALLAFFSLIPSLKHIGLSNYNRGTAFLVLVISLSLFITGAGPFGFDLPI
jgi:uncharacterized membrane protein YphA (DoxX/SURF4 family)